MEPLSFNESDHWWGAHPAQYTSTVEWLFWGFLVMVPILALGYIVLVFRSRRAKTLMGPVHDDGSENSHGLFPRVLPPDKPAALVMTFSVLCWIGLAAVQFGLIALPLWGTSLLLVALIISFFLSGLILPKDRREEAAGSSCKDSR